MLEGKVLNDAHSYIADYFPTGFKFGKADFSNTLLSLAVSFRGVIWPDPSFKERIYRELDFSNSNLEGAVMLSSNVISMFWWNKF